MSFFNETKNAGTLLLIIGLISVVIGIASVFILEGEMLNKILGCIGSVVSGLLEILLGIDIRNGACRIQIKNFFSDVTSKFGVLVAVLAVDGIGNIIAGAFSLQIMSVVVGIIILIMAYLMVQEDKGIADKVIWIILAIVFVIGIIASAIACLALVGIPMLLLYLMLFIYLLSPEVKEKMGM